jgi:hypothetical protein
MRVMSVFQISTACVSLMIINPYMMVLKMAEVDSLQRLQRRLKTSTWSLVYSERHASFWQATLKRLVQVSRDISLSYYRVKALEG